MIDRDIVKIENWLTPSEMLDINNELLEIGKNLKKEVNKNGNNDTLSIYSRIYVDDYYVENIKQAAEKAKTIGRQILLTLGSKNIDPFLCEEFLERIFIRMLPDPQLIQDLLSKGVSPDRIIAIQGPFSISLNKALMVDRSIDCLITKSSGKEGGIKDKVTAAQELDISVIVIKRPEMDYPVSFSDQNKMTDNILKDQ